MNKNNEKIKTLEGQTNALVIVFFIIIFLGAAMFLLTMGKTSDTTPQNEYMNMYAKSLLVTLMKTDTDLIDSGCGTISDLAFYGLWDDCRCTDAAGTVSECMEWLAEKIDNGYFSRLDDKISFRKAGFDYYLSIQIGGKKRVLIDDVSPSPGDDTLPSLETEQKQKWAADISLFKRGTTKLEAQLIIAPKE